MNLLCNYDQFAKDNKTSGDVTSLRLRGVSFLNAQGLPTRKDEEWKYTNLKTLNEEKFVAVDDVNAKLSAETKNLIVAKMPKGFINIVFYNGKYDAELSQTADLPQGAKFQETTESSKANAEFIDAFEALNAAYFTKKYTLYVAAETSVPRPVHFLFLSAMEGAAASMSNPQVSVEIGTRASAKFVESYFGQSGEKYFVNSQVDIKLGESSKLTYVRLQNDSHEAINIGRTNFELSKSSQLHSLAYSTGAQLSRHNLLLELKAAEATAIIDGLYVVRGDQHVDNTTVIDHIVGACTTSQHYKGILADTSRAVFNGKVAIRQDAQKANSEQLNNNLLLSRYAEADSKPQLSIFADDVKAAHGSTVGQLDREELFYLESRAIPPDVAISMMSFGYVSELIYKLEDETMQTWLNKELKEAFSGLKLAGPK